MQHFYHQRFRLTLFLSIFIIGSGAAQEFKNIGYLPSYRFGLIDQIELEKLTHLNLAFANPDMEGNLSFNGQDITPIVSAAHAAGNEVFLSLAGGALTPDWAAAWKELIKIQNRSAFIHKIINYTLDHELDGIDVDLEWSHVDENYSGFVLELRDTIDQYGLPLTAALPGTYRFPPITDEALDAFDWINMMVYDLTGGWAPDMPGPHSPYSFAVNSLNYWMGQGVEKSRLTLGLPFYGYDFSNPSQTVSRTYGSLVAMNPDNAMTDQVGSTYYNGMPTIQAKTEFALEESIAGVMIWELGQDSYDQYSLLNVIWETIQNITSTSEVTALDFNAFPNPFEQNLQIESVVEGQLTLTDMNGVQLMRSNISSNLLNSIQTDHLPAGMYILTLSTEEDSFSRKLIKM